MMERKTGMSLCEDDMPVFGSLLFLPDLTENLTAIFLWQDSFFIQNM